MEETFLVKKGRGLPNTQNTTLATEEQVLLARNKKTLSIERNFAKFANFIFSPSHSKVDPLARVKMWASTDPDSGNKVLARIMIEPVARQTLTTFDLRTFLALQKIWWENPADLQNLTRFRLRMLARVMNLGWGLKTFIMLKASLLRLRKIPITWQFSFHDPENHKPIKFEEPINILAKLQLWTAEGKKRDPGEIQDKHPDRRGGSRSTFRFNEYIERNLALRHTKPIFFDTAMGLRGEIALSLYSFLDVIMADKIGWERRLPELFHEDLHIQGKYSHPAERKRLLERVIKELQTKPISTGLLSLAIVRTKDQRDYKLVVRKTKFQEPKRVVRPTHEQQYLVDQIIEITGDEHSRGYYTKIVREIAEPRIWYMISETKRAHLQGEIRTNPARYFTDLAERERVREY